MISIKRLYKIGPGPSSSHTMGPKNAVEFIISKYKNIDFVEMIFYGSLAKTGKGHLSDYIADLTFKDLPHKIIFDKQKEMPHPNTMVFKLFKNGSLINEITIVSIGGGLIKVNGEVGEKEKDIYPHNTFNEIKKYCLDKHLTLMDYILQYEPNDIKDYIEKVYKKMMQNIDNGLKKEGVLPGKLKVLRKAKHIHDEIRLNETPTLKEKRLISSYAFAVSEENASGEEIVTAPTCGSCGVLPSLVKYYSEYYNHEKIINGILIAGLIGLIVQKNASISGAECGCQAEIGTASSMGAAFVAYLYDLNILGIERASEIALEHSLGMTCDPIDGYVQIPCIERNAIAAMRSISAASLSSLMGDNNSKISFDLVVKTMYETGKDLKNGYKETSSSGLAKKYKEY